MNNKLLGVEDRKIGIKHEFSDFKAITQYVANLKKMCRISMRIGTTDSQKNTRKNSNMK